MKYRYIILFISTLLYWGCTEDTTYESNEMPVKDISLRFEINTLSVNDPASISNDDTFSNMAVFLFKDDASSTPERIAFLPSFTSVSSKELYLTLQPGNKTIYIIANYVGKTFKSGNGNSITLSTNTTKAQLEDMIIESSSGFTPNALIMVGKMNLSITNADNNSSITIPLRRLQSRVDVHVYKGNNFGTRTVLLKSIALCYQILNSEIKYDYSFATAQMRPNPMSNTQTMTYNTALSPYTNGTPIQPSNAQAIFYSYQNIVSSFSPLPPNAPYLHIIVSVDGTDYSYTGYITDNNQTTGKYSLAQNNLYQITAILDIDSKIVLNMNVLPWNQKTIEYKRPITSNDFTFGAWNSSWGGTNAKAINTGTTWEDAVFQFELKAPFGAAWTATLTNGLDFGFTSSTAGTSTTTVSKGYTNVGNPYIIAVRASRVWTGSSRDTEFYITVEGTEIPINPIIGTQRKYDGTDTRIKITQVSSHN